MFSQIRFTTKQHKKNVLGQAMLVLMLFTLSIQGSAAKNLPTRSLNLYAGEVRVLKIKDVDRIAVGDGKLLSTSITKSGQLIILAETAGETVLHMWGKTGWERNYIVRVAPSNPRSAVGEMRTLLSDVNGIEIRSVGGRAVIDGSVGKDGALRIDAIKKVYPNVLDLAKRTEAYYDKMITMKVQITQFSSNHLEQLGINWDTTILGPEAAYVNYSGDKGNNLTIAAGAGQASLAASTTGSNFAFFGLATAITSRINFMVSNGDALVLASPTLATRSGGKASFLAGGKIPLPTTNAQGQSNVTFEEFGVKLDIEPTADNDGNITAHLETEISAPDSSIAPINNIPGFFTRRSSADLTMKQGETMVISGLLNSDLSKNVSGIKYLMDIPIIGALFRNTNRVDKKTELVVFVTPQIIDANSKVNTDALAQHVNMIKKFKDITDLKNWMHEDSGNRDLLE